VNIEQFKLAVMSDGVFTDEVIESFFLGMEIMQENDIDEALRALNSHRPELMKKLTEKYKHLFSKNNLPKIGDEVYVPTHNGDYIGGLVKVIGIDGDRIAIEEHNGMKYQWVGDLDKEQDELKALFGTSRAYFSGVI